MIESILARAGVKTPKMSSTGVFELPFTRNTARLGLDNQLDSVVDYKRGSRYLLEATDVKARGLGIHPDLGNTGPLNVFYLNALIHKDPFLPDEVLVDPARAPEAHYLHFSESTYVTGFKGYQIIWLFPDGGIEHLDHPGYYYIPGFPDYAVSDAGEVIQVSDGATINANVADGRKIDLTTGDGNLVTIGIASIMVMAFGKYDKTMSDEIFFLDGDDTNFTLANLVSEITDDNTLSVEMTSSDTDLVENF